MNLFPRSEGAEPSLGNLHIMLRKLCRNGWSPELVHFLGKLEKMDRTGSNGTVSVGDEILTANYSYLLK